MSGDRRRAYVIGGGIAGLVAAFGLADRGYRVTLFESRRQCGGRAFSSHDRVFDRALDNGNHVMLGCYRATRALLRRLGTERDFLRPASLRLAYRFDAQRTIALRLPPLPVPLAMPWSLLRLSIPLRSRLRALWGMLWVLPGAPADWTLAEWLRRRRQTGDPDDVLWRPLCRAVMNVDPEEAGAADFLTTLREAFLGSAGRAAIWVPRRTWGELLGAPAPRALAAAGVELSVGSRCVAIDTDGDRVSRLRFGNGADVDVGPQDVVVSAMQWFALDKLMPDLGIDGFASLRSAPIVTANFELPGDAVGPADDGPVVALVGGDPFHYLLRTPGEGADRFALLSGGSRVFDGMPVDGIADLARDQLVRFYAGAKVERATVRIRKEQHATFVAGPGGRKLRPRPGRAADGPRNLWLCGDWTDTGLPSTLESAARSAQQCVREIGPASGQVLSS